MSIITRSEATHRLKLISASVNEAVSATREGHWKQSFDAAAEARRLLEALIPHIEEAAGVETELVGSLSQEPVKPSGKGAFGYRGKTHKPEPVERSSQKPPEAVNGPRVFSMPASEVVVEPAPEPIQEVVVFDPRRIAGTSAFIDAFRQGTVEVLSKEELAISERFARLSASVRARIEQRFAETGKPVAVKLRPVETKVGVHGGK